jgi:hypothetical protein
MLSTLTFSTNTWGASSTSPATMSDGRLAAWIRAMDAPSLWPKRTARRTLAARSTSSSTFASWCMNSTGRGSSTGSDRP